MFKYVAGREEFVKHRRRIEAISEKQLAEESVNSIVFVTLAEGGSIDEVTAAEHTYYFAEWDEGVTYAVDNIRRYEGNLYKCIQSHTSLKEWSPDTAVSLWKKIGDTSDEYPEWSQPIGAHDAYQEGDKVSHCGKHWQSIVDNNVWEPSSYGWNEINGI